MQYEPIKRTLGRFFSGSPLMQKLLYSLLDLLLLRSWHVRKALRKVSRSLPPDASVLDAGCGFGQYTWRMARLNRGWKISAVDISSEHIEDCTRFFGSAGLSGRVTCRTADLTLLNDKDLYDLVLSVDVMEHISDDLQVFRNFYSSLRENGILLISTPSDQGGSDVHSDDEKSFIDEHVRDGYGAAEISEKLSAAGFGQIDTLYTYGKPGNISWRLSMKYPVKFLNMSYFFFLLLPFWYIIFYPVSFILNILDVSIRHKTGTGLLVTARKVKQ